MRELSDETLVKQAARGSVEAFDRLANRWRGRLFRLGYHLSGNREEAEEICQETLVKAYRGLGSLGDHSKFPVWVRRIALRVYQDHRRREKGRRVIPLGLMRDEDERGNLVRWRGTGLAEDQGPSRAVETQELRELLENALGQLPVEQREAIVMREFQDLTTGEIAEITGVPTATVRTRIFYGLRKLHDILTLSPGEGGA